MGINTNEIVLMGDKWFLAIFTLYKGLDIFRENKGKGKGIVIPVYNIKAYRGRIGITPLILNLGIRYQWWAG